MLRTIAISESIFDLLDREAKRNRLSPNCDTTALLGSTLNFTRVPVHRINSSVLYDRSS